jgi:serine/threonine-protein kinase
MQSLINERENLLAGRYRRLRRLGTGGMARVLLAEDEVLGREVAVKQLPSEAPEEALRRFRREARLGASLNHPNVVAIYDTVSDEDAVLIVMEFVDGESLAERLQREPLDQSTSLTLLAQIASALDHAHEQGVVHRDVKPSNILIAEDGTAKLADLGIATAVDATAITGSGNVIGTLAYIAPERLRGEGGDTAADVYSLAAVAFELLSGRRAHPEKTPDQLVRRIEQGAPDLLDADPDASPAAAAVLRKAMSSDPGERPASAGELVRGLRAALERGVETQPAETTRRMPAAAPVAAAAATAAEAAADTPPHGERPPFVPPEGQPHRSGRTRALAITGLGIAAGLLIALVVLSGGGDGGSEPVAERRDQAQPDRTTQSPPPAAPAAEEPAPPPPPPSPEPADTAASAEELNDQGFALIGSGRYDEAIPILQQAVDTADPSSLTYAFALFNLGSALRLAGRPEEAIPILEARLEIPNQRGVVRRELDLAYAEAGRGSSGGGGGGEEDD